MTNGSACGGDSVLCVPNVGTFYQECPCYSVTYFVCSLDTGARACPWPKHLK